MGQIKTPTYRLEIQDQSGWHTQVWRGPANVERLEREVAAINHSMLLGNINAPVSESLGFVPYISNARIVRQATNEVVATYKMAMFQTF